MNRLATINTGKVITLQRGIMIATYPRMIKATKHMHRIMVDFNSLTPEPDERVPISVNAQPHLKQQLCHGDRVLLCMEEIEVEGLLQHDKARDDWSAKPDWNTVRYV